MAHTSHSMDEQAAPARLRNLPSRLLALTAMYADRVVSEGLAGADAHKWHYAVLVTLQESGPVSQAELSRRTGIYRSDLVTVINELADRGHVERTPDPTDRRRNVITLTEQGRRHLRRLDELIAALQDEVLQPLSEPEREQLTELLARLLLHHGRSLST
ncbi:MarR family winged helix-turn-helix transcriptional regulator [Acrocarpospora catenulata]|uniref:MarR family winged helix-turn-helix transcriptional regulator n=1 Tax=Acrocarpospora catenulata TaxID=2836182 RepID=UPI0027DFEFB9|nr:MarR family transcriptional regulator [Acrocarpospora catenulata]